MGRTGIGNGLGIDFSQLAFRIDCKSYDCRAIRCSSDRIKDFVSRVQGQKAGPVYFHGSFDVVQFSGLLIECGPVESFCRGASCSKKNVLGGGWCSQEYRK